MKYCIILIFAALHTMAANIPVTKVVNDKIAFTDDIDFENMQLAIERQLISFSKLSLTTKIKFGDIVYSRADLKSTLTHFLKIVKTYKECKSPKHVCTESFSNLVNEEFNVYKPVPLDWEKGFKEDKSFFTAYYSPDFEASFTKTKRFKYPIYKKPTSSKLASMTRDQIDFEGKFAGKDLEIAYVDSNYYDLWLFHVEGGGRMKVKSKSGEYKYYYLSYTGNNGQKFRMLSEYMLKNKMITPENKSVLAQSEYLKNHPEDVEKVMKSSPSYIYFKVSQSEPLGVRNMPLTEKRSLATDRRKYKVYGILNFIQSKKAYERGPGELGFKDYSRFYISQDTGGGIKGNARSDLYFGYGKEAQMNANSVALLGNQYFLVKKKVKH